LLTDNEKKASIEYILNRGFIKPQTFWGRISKMYHVVGIRCIFWDLSYSLIFATITLLGFIFLFLGVPINFEHSAAFAFSPILFLLIILFSEMSDRACGIYELKQTCHYTSRQMTALRCFCHSALGIPFAVLVTVFSTENVVQFFRLLPLCLGGVFFCATIELSVIRFTRNKWTIAAFPIIWIFMNLALTLIFWDDWELFLAGLPVAFTISFAIVCAAVFIYQISKLLKEGNHYAIA